MQGVFRERTQKRGNEGGPPEASEEGRRNGSPTGSGNLNVGVGHVQLTAWGDWRASWKWKVAVTPTSEAPNLKQEKGERKGGGGCRKQQRSRLS